MKPRRPGDRLRGKIVAEERSSLMIEGFVASLLSTLSGHRTATDGELPFSRAELLILLTLDLLSAFTWACLLHYRFRLNRSDGRDRVVLARSGNSHLLNRRLPLGLAFTALIALAMFSRFTAEFAAHAHYSLDRGCYSDLSRHSSGRSIWCPKLRITEKVSDAQFGSPSLSSSCRLLQLGFWLERDIGDL